MDDRAASPLVVLSTFVAIAVVVTIGLMLLLVDTPGPALDVAVDQTGSPTTLVVSHVDGGLRWDDLTVRFFDAAGQDRAGAFLSLPAGAIKADARIPFEHEPAAGAYTLRITHNGVALVEQPVVF